uniref:EGF-like domain-containing protein n=1 Tax=Aquila chrysaetos chrysaetos TaxID=223781 RepID=A0A663FHA8_AQUCH
MVLARVCAVARACAQAPPRRRCPPPFAAAVVSICERNPQICGPGRCVPRQGGYTCLCHPGFWLSTQDVDECRRSPWPCPNGHCENSVGSYRCLCSPGYRPSAAGTNCQGQWGPWVPPTGTPGSLGGLSLARVLADVDECAQSPPPCTHGCCENLPGSYCCACPTSYWGTVPDEPYIDECKNHLACPGRCANTEGSFRCECRHGYRAGTGGAPCTDVNECLEGDFCFPHGECLNTEGSYTCLCAQGYTSTPQGTACTDVDECQHGGVCKGGRCANTDGSFECHCPAGFRTDADKALCQDVDECQEYSDSLCGAQRCDNIPGSYHCCQLFGPQLCWGGVCLNASPGFSCYCPSGYYY